MGTLRVESTASAFGGSESHGLHVILVVERKYVKKTFKMKGIFTRLHNV